MQLISTRRKPQTEATVQPHTGAAKVVSDGWWQLETPYGIGRVLMHRGVVEAVQDTDLFGHLIGTVLHKLWKRYALVRIDGPNAPLQPGIKPLPTRYTQGPLVQAAREDAGHRVLEPAQNNSSWSRNAKKGW